MGSDPYSVLGVPPEASDEDVRAAYRRLVKLHHPDHNSGSHAAEARFEAVQEAYSEIRRLRAQPRAGTTGAAGQPPPGRSGQQPPPRRSGQQPPPRRSAQQPPPRQTARPTPPPPPGAASADPDLDRRLADIERQVREAQRARDRAQRAARKAAHRAMDTGDKRATDEELGYFTTEDTLGKILADARVELTQRFDHAREHPVARRVSDLIAGLEELAEGLDRPRRGDSRDH